MCGIAGVVTPDPGEAESALLRMVPTMVHRGPDDSGHEILPFRAAGAQGVVGLGFRRLAILDLSPAGHQPMRDDASGNVLIFNGEIYNFATLRAELEQEGCRFRGTSDTEVLLQCLTRRGEAALERLEGMFAFAFYRAHDQALLLARDPLGIKPLYVARAAGRTAFASEVRTLLASGLVSRNVDAAGIADVIAFGSVQGPRTVFSDIEEFPAGHCQWIGGQARRFWWFPAISPGTGGDAVGSIRRLVREAVSRHLVADVPVGIFLSAGIDSTIVAACAAELSSSVTSFTVGIGPRHPDDETAVAEATARRFGIRHEIMPVGAAELPPLWHDWIASLDSPSIDGFNTFLVTKALADRGIKVGLSGLGADELFGGYPVFRSGPRLRWFLATLSLLPAAALAPVAQACLAACGRRALGEKLATVIRGGRSAEAIAIGLRRVASNDTLHMLGLEDVDTDRLAGGLEAGSSVPADDFNAISRMELSRYMRATLLRDSDANSMRHSLELRVPFLDRTLAEYVLSLPGPVKAGAGRVGKHLLRAAFADRLPAAVTDRRKTGFTLPVGTWMQQQMRPFCEAAIAGLADAPWLDGNAVTRIWRNYLDDPRSMPWSRPFALVVLGDYLHRHRG
jgi:asparagine synthase (glutamine-hydrolysing)